MRLQEHSSAVLADCQETLLRTSVLLRTSATPFNAKYKGIRIQGDCMHHSVPVQPLLCRTPEAEVTVSVNMTASIILTYMPDNFIQNGLKRVHSLPLMGHIMVRKAAECMPDLQPNSMPQVGAQ